MIYDWGKGVQVIDSCMILPLHPGGHVVLDANTKEKIRHVTRCDTVAQILTRYLLRNGEPYFDHKLGGFPKVTEQRPFEVQEIGAGVLA